MKAYIKVMQGGIVVGLEDVSQYDAIKRIEILKHYKKHYPRCFISKLSKPL